MRRRWMRNLWRRLWRGARHVVALSAALTVLVWFASRWCYATWEWTGGGGPVRLSVHGGVAHVYHESRRGWIRATSAWPGTFVAAAYKKNPAPWHWRPHREVVQGLDGYKSFELVIPLWVVAAGLGTVALGLRWNPRFLLGPGYCRRCAYDLAGLPPGAACPECGGKR